MEDKLLELYDECKNELKSIGIDIDDKKKVGIINIKIAPRSCKRYGCCRQEMPDKKSKYTEKVRNKKYLRYGIYKIHNIEISNWVMQLNDDIIKNTIMHEIIHCFPYCNNHGEDFKKYANYINKRLNYNVTRVGDKNEDLRNSNLNTQNETFNYKVECSSCGYLFYRKRIDKYFTLKYRCGKCGR